jgi:hypothetical protein
VAIKYMPKLFNVIGGLSALDYKHVGVSRVSVEVVFLLAIAP